MRLIDTEALEEKIENLITRFKALGRKQVAEDYNFVLTVLSAAPTIEAKPVVHAHWEYDPNGMDWGIGAWRCSKCRCKNDNLPNQNWTSIYQFAGSKYCPCCGAQMDEEVSE